MFSCNDISGINDIRIISNPIQTPSHEFDEIEIKIPPINVVDRRFFLGCWALEKRVITLWMGYEHIRLTLAYSLYMFLLITKLPYTNTSVTTKI
jgi:hypothetical protein